MKKAKTTHYYEMFWKQNIFPKLYLVYWKWVKYENLGPGFGHSIWNLSLWFEIGENLRIIANDFNVPNGHVKT